jgi:signal transduction histidine kinase
VTAINDTGDPRRLLDAILPVASDLSLPVVLERIVESACELVGARYGALGVLAEDNTLAEFITVGIDADTIARIGPPPQGHGVLGLLIWDPRPVRMDDIGQHPSSYGFPPNHPPMHSFLGAPVRVRDKVFGNLYLSEKQGAPRFTEQDEELVVGLAAVAGVAIEKARLHARVRDLAVVEDRERIARDLHDTVIQQLYATGMSLTATLRITEKPEVAARLRQAIDDLDHTMRSIRSTIFALEAAEQGSAGLRADVLRLVGRAENALGFAPRLAFDGLVDTTVPDGVADHLLATLRETLSNVAKHARARRVDVAVSVTEGTVELRVVDDGVGVPDVPRAGGSGLRNLAERAEVLGGVFTAQRVEAGGTVVTWRVPLSPARPSR